MTLCALGGMAPLIALGLGVLWAASWFASAPELEVRILTPILALFGFMFLAPGMGLGVFFLRAGKQMRRSERDTFAHSIAKWQTSTERWQLLYYCARDDGVFVPGETGFIPLTQIDGFLYADQVAIARS